MPTPTCPLFSPTVPNVMSDPTAAAIGSSTQSNIMSSPFAAPFIYSSMMQAAQPLAMYGRRRLDRVDHQLDDDHLDPTAAGRYGMMGMSTGQLGLLMLATQNNGGVGSGQMSGARPGTQNAATATHGRDRPSAALPPGRAGWRPVTSTATRPRTPYPQSYLQPANSLLPVIPPCRDSGLFSI